jgi:hypothetical protein
MFGSWSQEVRLSSDNHVEWRRHGYGLVLALLIASTAFQLVASSSDGARLVVIAVQAATLVAAVRTAQVERTGVRAAALLAAVAVLASLVTWVVRGDIPPCRPPS